MDSIVFDAAVVGAGPAGSTAAIALAQRGWNILLLEQDLLPRHKVCGEFLSPEAQNSLSVLGLRETVSELRPVALHHAELTSPRGQRIRTGLPGAALGISRYALDAALAEAAQARGVTLWTGVTVMDVAQQEEGYLLELRTKSNAPSPQRPESVRARAVILACGRHNKLTIQEPESSARAPNHSHSPQHHVGVKCHFENLAIHQQVELYFFQGGYGGVNPVEGKRSNFCMLVTYEAFRSAGKSPQAMLNAARISQPALDDRLADACPVSSTVKTVAAVDTSRPAAPWQGAPCIGDAAAMITPLCGDGMAMAMRGSEICVPLVDAFLRGDISKIEWADMHRRIWHAEFDRRIGLGRLLQDSLSKPLLADLLIGAGRFVPPLVSYLVHATRGSQRAHAA